MMWRVIVPPDNWRGAFEIEEIGNQDAPRSTLHALREVAGNLGLVITVDEAEEKIYLGLPKAAQEIKPIGPDSSQRLDYPSGMSLSVVDWKLMGDKYRPADLDRAEPLVAWKQFRDRAVSEHFKLGEFACHDEGYGYLRLAPELVELLEKIRAGVGGSINVTSGYRPPAYQALVNPSVINSEHMNGTAADITAVSDQQSAVRNYNEFYALCDRLNPNGGVGRYSNQGFVHVDVRGSRARWG